MALEYKIEDSGHSLRLCLNSFTIVEVMYSIERCITPVEKDEAEIFINKVKERFELLHPTQTLDEEEYEPSDFFKLLESISDDNDDCDCDDDSGFGKDLMRLMLLKAMMD